MYEKNPITLFIVSCVPLLAYNELQRVLNEEVPREDIIILIVKKHNTGSK